MLVSQRASEPLRPFVRAYAQRWVSADLPIAEVPPRLEQILQFDFGVPTRVLGVSTQVSMDGTSFEPPRAVIAGGFATSGVRLDLRRGVETFVAFFRPSGFSQLFSLPVREVTSTCIDVEALLGHSGRELWQQLADAVTFAQRVALLERFLVARLDTVRPDVIQQSAQAIFHRRGNLTISRAAAAHGMHVRQFERRFRSEIGITPKLFARVARFQAALDVKLTRPQFTWRDVAHELGYFDQTHMVHDFKRLGGATPSQLITIIGDARPPAVVKG